jgi:hypothetical protein
MQGPGDGPDLGGSRPVYPRESAGRFTRWVAVGSGLLAWRTGIASRDDGSEAER